ncbi:hypothetical protein Drorol1_Dr00000625 [Drosera rotundifolia]
MAERGELRLVRCPKCENLLPELPDYSVYQCGGCGAVLRANKGDVEGENGAVRDCEDRVRVSGEKQEDLKGKEAVNVVENGDYDDSKGLMAEGAKLEGDSLKKENVMGNESLVHLESRSDEVKVHDENGNGLRSVGRVLRRKARERRVDDGFLRARRGDVGGIRFVNGSYAGEGTSSCHWNCNLENETTLKNENGKCRPNTVEFKEAEREAILRKLDELKDQLSQTCDVDEIKDDRSSLEPRTVHPKPHSNEFFQDQSPGIRGKSRQLCPENKHSALPHCLDRCNESLPVANGYGVTPHGCHPLMQNSGYVSRLEDSFGPHTMRRPPPHWLTSRHQHPPSHPYSYPSGHYVSPMKDLHEPFSPIHNQLSCSCYHCHEKRHLVPRQMPSSAFDSLRVPHVENKPIIPCHHELPSILGPRGCNSRVCNASSTSSYGIDPHARWHRDLDLDLGGYSHPRPRQVVLANGGLHCHPVAGGSPLITCHNCFQLLKLSKKVLPSGKSPWKICCGHCSSIISLSIVDGKLVAVDPPKKKTLKEVLYSSNEVEYDKPYRSCTDPVKPFSSSFRSEGYDMPGYEFMAADQVGTSEELPNVRSVSPSTSDEEDCELELNTGSVLTNAAEIPVKATLPLTTSSSPIENFEDSSMNRVVNRCGIGSLSSRSDQERAPAIKGILRQNSLKESMATETESKNDFPEAEVTQDTMDAIREEDQPRGKRGIDAFLAGLIKKSFRDFSRSHQAMENGRRHVTVNGHVVPDRLIKKAEKLAGPIYPGQYWYDYRAGFWGEMGGPCLGIIPPFIEEFNYPMPENCAGGDTGVFVNGRELHQKDLDLLVSRGLPSTRDRSYIIDISGRVVDEDTSEELDNLGRLAPTIEKVKHGFGMRVPKAAA